MEKGERNEWGRGAKKRQRSAAVAVGQGRVGVAGMGMRREPATPPRNGTRGSVAPGQSPCPRSTVSDKAVTFQLRKYYSKTCHPRRKVVHDSNSTIDTACCFNRTTQVGVGRVSLARGKTAGQGRPAPRALS